MTGIPEGYTSLPKAFDEFFEELEIERKLRWQQGQKTLQEVRDSTLSNNAELETKIKANALVRFCEAFSQQHLTAIYKSELDSKYYIFDAQRFGLLSGEAFRYFLPANTQENSELRTLFVQGVEFQSWLNQRFNRVSVIVEAHVPSQPLHFDEPDAESTESHVETAPAAFSLLNSISLTKAATELAGGENANVQTRNRMLWRLYQQVCNGKFDGALWLCGGSDETDVIPITGNALAHSERLSDYHKEIVDAIGNQNSLSSMTDKAFGEGVSLVEGHMCAIYLGNEEFEQYENNRSNSAQPMPVSAHISARQTPGVLAQDSSLYVQPEPAGPKVSLGEAVDLLMASLPKMNDDDKWPLQISAPGFLRDKAEDGIVHVSGICKSTGQRLSIAKSTWKDMQIDPSSHRANFSPRIRDDDKHSGIDMSRFIEAKFTSLLFDKRQIEDLRGEYKATHGLPDIENTGDVRDVSVDEMVNEEQRKHFESLASIVPGAIEQERRRIDALAFEQAENQAAIDQKAAPESINVGNDLPTETQSRNTPVMPVADEDNSQKPRADNKGNESESPPTRKRGQGRPAGTGEHKPDYPIAEAAARLMNETQGLSYAAASRKAADRLGIHGAYLDNKALDRLRSKIRRINAK